MWLFSDGQGNFDPLRLLWSETPFNRSSTQEFKLILSLPTTASLQRLRVEVKALPHCRSCWQPAELKALSNADDQCEWLAPNGLHSHFYERQGVGSDSYWDRNCSLFPFKKYMKFANNIICFAYSSGILLSFYVALLLKSPILRFWLSCCKIVN